MFSLISCEKSHSSISDHSIINAHFLKYILFPPSSAEPLPLMDLCRRAARLALGRERLQEIESLPLPQSLKNYLQYQ